MKFSWVTINVSNMEIAFLGNGETKVELIFDAKSDKRHYGEDISIGFEVESIERTMESLKSRNIKIHSGPHQPNPTLEFIYVLDPDRLRVQFIENIV